MDMTLILLISAPLVSFQRHVTTTRQQETDCLHNKFTQIIGLYEESHEGLDAAEQV
jgi:hypothetical protein